MNIYQQKRVWKWYLFAAGILIVIASLWYTNILVQKISTDERQKLKIWAEAIQRKARFVKYTESFFQRMQVEEQKRVHQLAQATQRLASASVNTDVSFYTELIEDNTTIPVILTDDKDNILEARNVDFDIHTVKKLEGKLKQAFSHNLPLVNEYLPGYKTYLYYSDSRLYTELRKVLEDLIQNFFSEVLENSSSVPVIITDSTRTNLLGFGNLDSVKMRDKIFVKNTLQQMEAENTPIELNFQDQGKNYIFYKNSFLLTQLRYYPFFQLGIIAVFLFISYLLFSTARRSEQNQVWAGMAKETAHQLGTPISSIMAWIELMRMRNMDAETVREMEKDVKRLETIADRFSKIGSAPLLHPEDIVKIIYDTVDYLKLRTSKKVNFTINVPREGSLLVPVSPGLFEWVLENICRNSVDAMAGNGQINIILSEEKRWVTIDISDTGKGIPRSQFKAIFKPGFTSKKRGWGLGLTLARRIIEEYHKGKIFVKSSALNEGTTLRLQIPRNASAKLILFEPDKVSS